MFLLGAFILAHLALALVEILYRPVFPWDGWVNWIYRAKAWYLSGAITPLDPVSLWERGEPRHLYAIAGHHYPALLPLTAYAMALLTGAWSETLVNLPTALAGIGLAAGTYLISRDLGLGRLLALTAAYLVLSTPLIGAHLSLAGQADIWMALTCGLGFGSLLAGLARRRVSRWAIGMALIALCTQFKAEGSVWLLTAVALTAIVLRPRIVLVTTAVLTLVLAGLWHLGLTRVDLPLLGSLGVVDGRLYVPLLGDYAIRQYDLADDYLKNFFLRGSWNLLWFFVAGAALVALRRCRQDRGSAVALAFFALAAAAQAFIFFLTEQGAWAEDWTAINRLPLHFVPALVIAGLLVLVPDSNSSRADEVLTSRTAAILVAALVVLAASAVVLAKTTDREGILSLPGSGLRIPIGGAIADGKGLRIRRFDNNIALVSSGPISVESQDTGVVRVRTSGSNRKAPVFFWRTARGSELHRASLAGLGELYLDVQKYPEWRGRITEVGVLFYDDGGSVTIQDIALHAASSLTRLRQIISDWSWIAPWSQSSVNWLPAGNPQARLPMALALACVLVIGVIACALVYRRTQRAVAFAVLGVFLATWIAGDLRWLGQRATLAGSTIRSYEFLSSEPLRFGNDAIVAASVRRALCDQDPRRQARAASMPRLLISSDSDVDMRFEVLRAKYHALPAPAYAHERGPASMPVHLADRVLVLKLRYGRNNAESYDSASVLKLLSQRSAKPLRIAWEDSSAFLLTGGDDPADDPACWAQAP